MQFSRKIFAEKFGSVMIKCYLCSAQKMMVVHPEGQAVFAHPPDGYFLCLSVYAPKGVNRAAVLLRKDFSPSGRLPSFVQRNKAVALSCAVTYLKHKRW